MLFLYFNAQPVFTQQTLKFIYQVFSLVSIGEGLHLIFPLNLIIFYLIFHMKCKYLF